MNDILQGITIEIGVIIIACSLFGLLIGHLLIPHISSKMMIGYSVFSVWLPMIIIAFIFQMEIPGYFDIVGAGVAALNSGIATEILREGGIKKLISEKLGKKQ